jgi:hypothetical protein
VGFGAESVRATHQSICAPEIRGSLDIVAVHAYRRRAEKSHLLRNIPCVDIDELDRGVHGFQLHGLPNTFACALRVWASLKGQHFNAQR